MKQVSDEHYLARYEGYMTLIEEAIESAAQNGFYHTNWSITKNCCYDWTRSPLFDYFEGLKKEGYQIEVADIVIKDEGPTWSFEIAWR